MREVAVTDGDKVEAQLNLDTSVNGYGIGDLVKFINEVPDAKITRLTSEYEELYQVCGIASKRWRQTSCT